MRKSFAAALAFAAIVAAATPATAGPTGKAAPRQESSVRERDQSSPAMTAIRKLLKRFGIKTTALPIGPWPTPETDDGTTGN